LIELTSSQVISVASNRLMSIGSSGSHSAECYQWHHDCAIAEVERLREKVKSWGELEQQYQAGCAHCTHPQYVGIRCNVCGRWTEQP
jgi:hypothetical protein